ncbi:SOS response-associated peptidase [Microbulbifer sp. S227A]|uniref:SOS response-associated peptidase n=1 Tax=Microbulbifer sp. S227A TaxID=3415131 RepID=UPI003C7EBAA1
MFLTEPPAALAAALGVSPDPVSEEPARLNIAPGQDVVALSANGLMRMRWGIIPVGRVNARGRPVMETIVNARSETVFDKTAFAGMGRAILPVNGWYEWTGEKRRKTAWRITPLEGGLLYFAAISDVWQAPGGQRLHQLAPVTCAPSGDVHDVHHRMAVILNKADIAAWLHAPDAEAQQLMRPWPDGRLTVEPAAGIDWTAP